MDDLLSDEEFWSNQSNQSHPEFNAAAPTRSSSFHDFWMDSSKTYSFSQTSLPSDTNLTEETLLFPPILPLTQVKVEIIVDWDPDGFEIMLVYKHGSRVGKIDL
jgi:hypothetical protein